MTSTKRLEYKKNGRKNLVSEKNKTKKSKFEHLRLSIFVKFIFRNVYIKKLMQPKQS